jgi:homogentisate 1,2-dioxygenase
MTNISKNNNSHANISSFGNIPSKRHIQFEKPTGGLFYEELFGTIGFDGMSSLLYHHHRPTQVKEILESISTAPKIAVDKNIASRKLIGFNVAPAQDFLDSRVTLMVNNDLHIGVAAPQQSLRTYYYKNADADELLFIHKGKGTLRTMMGNIPFEYGDYLVIPRGMIYQIDFDTTDNRLFFVESFHPIYTPKDIVIILGK